MNNHPSKGEIVDREWLAHLRPNTIFKSVSANPPVVAHGDEVFRIAGHMINPNKLAGPRFEVLWVPTVELPALGERVELEQLRIMPRTAVVINEDPRFPYSYQLVEKAWVDVDSRVAHDTWTGWGFSGDEDGLWQHASGRLRLLWLPNTTKD